MNLNAIDRAKPQKLYYQLLEILRGQIERNDWKVGNQIPTEEQLCSQYNVSKATVRLAIEDLVLSGYLKKLQGKGTFVRRRKAENSITMLVNFDGDGLYHNSSVISRVIEKKILHPDKNAANYLSLSDDDHCFFLSMLLIADGTPMLLQKLHIPHIFMTDFNDKEMADISVCEFLERKCGLKIHRVKEALDVSHLDGKDAGTLELPPNLAVLRARHIYYAHGDMPVSFSESLYRTDKHSKSLEFERLQI